MLTQVDLLFAYLIKGTSYLHGRSDVSLYNAGMANKKPKQSSNTIASNRRAKFDYHLSDQNEAGVQLMGWEVKALRDGKVNLSESFIQLHQGEAWLYGCTITPLKTVSTHYVAEPARPRKLLLHARELAKIFEAVNQKGYTCVATNLYWKAHLVKLGIAIGKGKKDHDKRDTEKARDWDRQKQRIMRRN